MYRFRNIVFMGLLSFLLIIGFIGCGDSDDDDDDNDMGVLGASKSVFIVNGAAETLSVFDIETSEITNDVLTVGKWPADIKIRDSKAYVINTGDNSVQIIDLETLTDVGLIDVGENTLPQRIGFVSDSKAYVSCNGNKSVKVVDLISQQVTNSIDVGLAPDGVAVAGQKVYVCNTAFDGATFSYGDGTVSVIDSATDTVTKTISVELNPKDIIISGDKALVLCLGNYDDVLGNLSIIDIASDTVVDTIALGTTPSFGFAVSPGGMVYFTASEGLISVDVNSGSVSAPLTDFANGAAEKYLFPQF